MEIKFSYGVCSDGLEKQAKAQGYTLGKQAETLEKLRFSLNMVRMHGLITDSQADKAYQKLHKKAISALTPLGGKQ